MAEKSERNPKGAGRKPGSKNKQTLEYLNNEYNSLINKGSKAVEFMFALMLKDEKKLGKFNVDKDHVSVAQQYKAGDTILKLRNDALALINSQQDTLKDEDNNTEATEETETGTVFSMKAVKK